MHKQEDTQQAAELRLAFMRHLPKRLETLRRRGLRLCKQGWDINAFSLLLRELQTLSGACGRYGLLDIGERLYALEGFVAPFIARVEIPDSAQSEKFARQLDQLEPLIAHQREEYGEPVAQAVEALTVTHNPSGIYPLLVTPPPQYWKRFGPAPTAVTAPTPSKADTQTPNAFDEAPAATQAAGVPVRAKPRLVKRDRKNAKSAPRVARRNGEQFKVFHLNDSNALARELGLQIEAAGYELSRLETIGELKEVLSAFGPHLVMIDAPFLGALEEIGELVKAARQRLGRQVALMIFSESGELTERLHGMRAGADCFIELPAQAAAVMNRVHELLDADRTDPFRVMIIEDDRSQALFAESILRKAGMKTIAVTDPLSVMDRLESFKPEFILMDLYMPNCSGMELTTIIREREAFVNTPIVFLSGEHDEDKHFEALNAGGDDFLSKPIRPKHLISAVSNRVRRARALGQRITGQNPRDPATGLFQRSYVLDGISAALAAEDSLNRGGGLFYVELEGGAQIRERMGLIAFDTLLNQIGAFLVSKVSNKDMVSRYGDTSFVLLCEHGTEDTLMQLATNLCELTAQEVFEHDGTTLHVNLAVGICSFSAGLGDAGGMLNAAERALNNAWVPGQQRIGVFHLPPAVSTNDADLGLLQRIRDALRTDEFQLLFQPIVSLQGGEEEQFQALLRLRGDSGQIHTASEILPVVERENLVAELDRWVLSHCLRVLTERTRLQRPVRLFANQSIASARDSQRAAWLGQMLETRGLSGEHLVIELNTRDVFEHVRQLARFGAEIGEYGVMLALSSFDANPPALQLLQHLPVKFVKLASRYSGESIRESHVREELRRIVDFAHQRDGKVIASHIEDAQTASLLWSAGVDYLQGDFVQKAAQELSFDFHATTA